ncbi:hypothetical protein GOP47_0023709 [Adiantum capillus-veneris]|uniref:Uncharacterized protein n=1 Tax=Adiantum capillus-veneris TaxID=13818 RepID=A0A9D4U3Y5_ADICA|nr:hypothetical protein GOP47_0023709 [Adiantum capillus-veneris]
MSIGSSHFPCHFQCSWPWVNKNYLLMPKKIMSVRLSVSANHHGVIPKIPPAFESNLGAESNFACMELASTLFNVKRVTGFKHMFVRDLLFLRYCTPQEQQYSRATRLAQ